MLGREREQQRLRECLDAARAGQGAVVLISGTAGIGKTALVDEAVREARAAGMFALSGSCYDLTTTPAYGPWREIARAYQPDEDLPALPAGLVARDGSIEFLNEMPGFLDDLASARPLVLVLEDLHWSDYESVELLRVVARRAERMALLFLVTYRQDDLHQDAPLYRLLPLLAREARAERIDLRPLDRAAVELLASLAYPGLEAADRERLAEFLQRRAEGNPLFTLELMRGLEEERLLTRMDDRWHVGDIDGMQVPALLRQLIDARLARTGEPDRQRLAVAAVIGQEATLDLWAAVLSTPDVELLETIERGSEAGLIDAPADGLSIRFRHALFRDALYQSILAPRRRELHRTIGDALARAGTGDVDAIARHFQVAGDDRAIEWLIRAGELAQGAYAWNTAAERLSEAAGLLGDSASARDRGWLSYRIGRLRRHSHALDACQWLDRAEHLGEQAGDEHLTGYACFDHGHVLVLTGDYVQGLEKMIAGDTLLDALPGPPDERISAWIADSLSPAATELPASSSRASDLRRGTLVQWLAEVGRYSEALALGEPYVASNAAQGASEQLVSSLGDAWFGLGRIHAARANPQWAREALARALDCYQRIGHRLLVAATVWVDLVEVVIPYDALNLDERQRLDTQAAELFARAAGALPSRFPERFSAIETAILSGRWHEALPLLDTMAEPGGVIETWRHYALAWLARIAREQGDPPRAWLCLNQVFAAGSEIELGTFSFLSACKLHLLAIDLCLDDADTDEASAWAQALDALIEWSGADRWQAELSLRRARLSLASGDAPSARREARAALEQALLQGQVVVEIQALQLLGEVGHDGSGAASRRACLEQSIALADSCRLPFELALGRLGLAELLAADDSDLDTARQLAESARVTLAQLDAGPALGRLDELSRRLAAGEGAKDAPFGLSKRELEVLSLVAQGLTDAEVADQLFISYRTVTTHLTSIFTKLGVSSRVSATRVAVEKGIVRSSTG